MRSMGLGGCATPTVGPSATATLTPTNGNTVRGQVQFAQKSDKVVVSGEIMGLKLNVEHGFHLYDKEDYSSGDGMSTGDHFNPDSVAYRYSLYHAGDFPV
jgi:superoxide dismutase, Cu-Zn family